MAKVPEPGSLTLRSEDWSVDGNPKSVSKYQRYINTNPKWGYIPVVYIYIFYIIYIEYVQNYTNRNPICIYMYMYILKSIYI
jgi:hypothetical protein